MGLAFARALLRCEVVAPNELFLVERSVEAISDLEEFEDCRIEQTFTQDLNAYETIIIAVKPQDRAELCAELANWLNPHQLVISIMAGVTIESLRSALAGHKKIVRCMPNLPLQIGLGMSVYATAAEVSPKECETVERILGSCGLGLKVEETLVDAATALSGTGPAYLFYFVENLVEVGKQMGFSENQARLLVAQTIHGSLQLWMNGELNPAELRAMVTSKAGTTAAAMEVFTQGKWGEVLQAAVTRARERSAELSKL